MIRSGSLWAERPLYISQTQLPADSIVTLKHAFYRDEQLRTFGRGLRTERRYYFTVNEVEGIFDLFGCRFECAARRFSKPLKRVRNYENLLSSKQNS